VIADAPNAAARKKLIASLQDSDSPAERVLYGAFQAELRTAGGWSHLLRASGRYPLTGHGDINTYAVFAETARTVIDPRGRSGLVLPTGIATDATTALFFGNLIASSTLVSLYDFENMRPIFPGVHRSYRFCVLTTSGYAAPISRSRFAFFLHDVTPAILKSAVFSMPPEEILLVNPNTGTAPVFRSRRDAEITIGIHKRVPVLWRDNLEQNPWNLSFLECSIWLMTLACSGHATKWSATAGLWKATSLYAEASACFRCTKPR